MWFEERRRQRLRAGALIPHHLQINHPAFQVLFGVSPYQPLLHCSNKGSNIQDCPVLKEHLPQDYHYRKGQKVLFKVHYRGRQSWSTDPHLPDCPTIVYMRSDHNHDISMADASQNCALRDETKEEVLKFSECGYSPVSVSDELEKKKVSW
ncbi:hypothetical protein LDENG_00064380 [Lucifuga dentata]|nr:hypothetical protein LDENG_00064380 [Lucifuga dentata]